MVLIFQHVPYEGPGLIADFLEGRMIPHMVVNTWEDDGFPLTPAGFSAVISMGGPMSANDGLPQLEKEKLFLKECLERDLPILGVCLGAQLLARALGAKVFPGDGPEVGWGDVLLTSEGKEDPVLGGLEESIPVLHWHGETFDLPEGAVRLASSDLYENQAFRYGSKAYGLQFHVEATSGMVEEWIWHDDPENGLVADPRLIRDDMARQVPRTHFWGSLIIGRFLDRILTIDHQG
jgi:GMP synthase-like glutamine amidotransferase